ncbi:MAG: nucleoside hydrolase, partial [Bacteroidota bacterium]
MIKSNRRQFLKTLGQLSYISVLPVPLLLQSISDTAKIKLLIDADTANEVDDLFAIAGALLNPKFEILGLSSAQWHTQQKAPQDSVGASQAINEKILELMGKSHIPHPQGSNYPMVRPNRPQSSAAADFIISQALSMDSNEKMSIIILGPATNVASAILLNPEIIPKLKVYYLGFWHHPSENTWSKREFNTNNDPNAVDALINTPNLEFHVMTASTSKHLVFEKTKVDHYLKGKGGIADYLVERWESYDRFWQDTDKEKQFWIMWDVAILEALAYPELAKEGTFQSPHDNLDR